MPFNSHTIHTIVETQWASFGLDSMFCRTGSFKLPSGPFFDACKFYYSETLDLTVPFATVQ